MDEERLRMRRELVQQARQRRTTNMRKTTVGKQFFLFRIYVTMMLVGAAFVLSLFHTDTTNTITESLKEAIAYEMPVATIEQWKQKAISVFQMNVEKKQQKTEQQKTEQQEIQQQNTTQQSVSQQDTLQNTAVNTFQPDLSENSGKIP